MLNLENRSQDLDHAFFPSAVFCNLNPLRKSFIYWIYENIRISDTEWNNVTIEEIFQLIGSQFFEFVHWKYREMTEKETKLLDAILNSSFFEDEFRNFLSEKTNGSASFDQSNARAYYNNLHLYHRLEESIDILGEYTQETKTTYHKNFFTGKRKERQS